MIQPNRMMDTAIPMNPAVILCKSIVTCSQGEGSFVSLLHHSFSRQNCILSLCRYLIMLSILIKIYTYKNRQKNIENVLQIYYNNHMQSVASIISALFSLCGKSAIYLFSMALFLDSSIVCARAGVKSARRNEHCEWLWLAEEVCVLSSLSFQREPRKLSQPFFWFMWLHYLALVWPISQMPREITYGERATRLAVLSL